MVLGLFAVPASAGADREVIREGNRSGRSDWKLKVKEDNAGLEVEFEVDQNVVGDTWAVRILRDGERIFAARRTTQSPAAPSRSSVVRATSPGRTTSWAARGTSSRARSAGER
jgi:hypothetical protein